MSIMSKKPKKTKLSVYTDGDGLQAIYVNGELHYCDDSIYGTDVVTAADGRLVRMRSKLFDASLDEWPESESELKKMIKGFQAGIDAGAAIGAPHGDCLVLRSEWNAKEGCFEDSIVEPEKESHWEPKVDGWVRLPEGKVAKVKCVKIVNSAVLYEFHGTNIMYTLGALKPWTPKIGEFVKVIREHSMNRGRMGLVKRDDGKNGSPYYVETESGMGWFTADCLEPAAPTDHIADANKKVQGDLLVGSTMKFNDGSRTVPRVSMGWKCYVEPDAYIGMLTRSMTSSIPNGWMSLHSDAKIEPRVVCDRFFRVSAGRWEELGEHNIDQANAQSWAAIRQIPSTVVESQELLRSKANEPEVHGHPGHVEGAWVEEASKEPETTARYDSDGRDVTELAGLWTEGDTQYREPTYADLANGPIEVEVCYDNTLETSWGKRMLYAVLPENVILRFVCEDPDVPESIYRWKHARVKVR